MPRTEKAQGPHPCQQELSYHTQAGVSLRETTFCSGRVLGSE